MAKKLEAGLRAIKGVTITQQVDANGVFAVFPKAITEELQKEIFFYVWNDRTNECRLMCSFDTTAEEIDRFITKTKELTER
jgi:threonine aldolase